MVTKISKIQISQKNIVSAILNKISIAFLLVLIIYLPFQALFGKYLEFQSHYSARQIFWIIHWYEFVILFLFVSILIVKLSEKRKVLISRVLALSLVTLGILSILFLSPSVRQGLEGFRFTLFGLIFFLFASEIGFNKDQVKKIINTYLVVVIIITLWAIIEQLFPLKYWSLWGVIDASSVFGYGWHNAGNFVQSASFLGGPNQLASYLLPAFFIVVSSIKYQVSSKETNKKEFWIEKIGYCLPAVALAKEGFLVIVSCAIATAIALSSSRSAIIGLLVGIIIWVFIQKKTILKIGALIIFSVVAALFFWLYSHNPDFKTLITHNNQIGHRLSLQTSWQEIQNRFHEPVKLIFGAGLGTAGPIAIKYGGIISESWYLQVLLELGIVGFLTYLVLFYYLGVGLWRKKKKGLFLGLISVLITTLFLHTLSDNPALTYTLFVQIGLSLNKENNG